MPRRHELPRCAAPVVAMTAFDIRGVPPLNAAVSPHDEPHGIIIKQRVGPCACDSLFAFTLRGLTAAVAG